MFSKKVSLSEVENVQGWRRVQVLPMGILASPQQAEAMLERVSPLARCNAGDSHKPPQHGCCGWHAMYNNERFERMSGEGRANILVSAIGETVLCREGWIAEQIRVDEVRVPYDFDEELARKIGERYEVPVYQQEEQKCTSESPSNESLPSQFMNQSFGPPLPLGLGVPRIGFPQMPTPRQFTPQNTLGFVQGTIETHLKLHVIASLKPNEWCGSPECPLPHI